MPIKFTPHYTISPATASALMSIEAVRQEIEVLPITPKILASLRKTARLYSTHYSTMIEGNRLEQAQVARVIEGSGSFTRRAHDEFEVKGYYAALEELERIVARRATVTEKTIGVLHALVMAGGRKKARTTHYRDGQNVIRDAATGSIVYMPPEAGDVPGLMQGLAEWIGKQKGLPAPLVAGIAHYQFATIHPWYDGNGRTARLLTSLVLHLGGYGLKGLYALEEYYARDLASYYRSLTLGPSHNDYIGRAEADITPWMDYFIAGLADAFGKVKEHATEAAKAGALDLAPELRGLNPRQRKALSLFHEYDEITARDIESLFEIKPRTARAWCAQWVDSGFLVVTNPSRKARKYGLVGRYQSLLG